MVVDHKPLDYEHYTLCEATLLPVIHLNRRVVGLRIFPMMLFHLRFVSGVFACIIVAIKIEQ